MAETGPTSLMISMRPLDASLGWAGVPPDLASDCQRSMRKSECCRQLAVGQDNCCEALRRRRRSSSRVTRKAAANSITIPRRRIENRDISRSGSRSRASSRGGWFSARHGRCVATSLNSPHVCGNSHTSLVTASSSNRQLLLAHLPWRLPLPQRYLAVIGPPATIICALVGTVHLLHEIVHIEGTGCSRATAARHHRAHRHGHREAASLAVNAPGDHHCAIREASEVHRARERRTVLG